MRKNIRENVQVSMEREKFVSPKEMLTYVMGLVLNHSSSTTMSLSANINDLREHPRRRAMANTFS